MSLNSFKERLQSGQGTHSAADAGKILVLLLFITFIVTIIAPASAPAADEYTTGLLIVGDTPGENVVIPQGTRRFHNGSIVVKNDGTLAIDGGELHLQGRDTHIYVNDNGRLLFRNGARLHYEQTYVGQHILYGFGNGGIEFSYATVDCDGSAETVKLYERASYRAVSTRFEDWSTKYLHNETSLTFIDVYKAGDIVFYDSPTIYAENTYNLMPWLHFGEGAVADLSFPDATTEQPLSMTIDGSQPGVRGIPWSLTFVDCWYVSWGLNPYPGSAVTVRDTNLTMSMMRYLGSGSYFVNGLFKNGEPHDDKTFPLPDRYLRLVNSTVKWWKVEAEEQAHLYANDLRLSEMMVKGDAQVLVTNSIVEGQTIHLGAEDRSYVHFKDGEVLTYVSVWNDATLVLDGSVVDWTDGKYVYQTRNIAHQRSRLYSVNSYLLSPPEAMDRALAMTVRIDTPESAVRGSQVVVPGAAWIDHGELSPVRFDSYLLAYQREGAQTWVPIKISNLPVVYPDTTLAIWNTNMLPAGTYTLRLSLFTRGDDPTTSYKTHYYPATKKIMLQ